jgi:hypothetical protein
MENLNVSEIVERMKSVIHTGQISVLATHLGKKSGSSVSNWITNGTVSYKEICIFALKNDTNINWLLTGEGDRLTGVSPYAVSREICDKYPLLTAFLAVCQTGDISLMKQLAIKFAETLPDVKPT